jgi:hypothetical protein
MVVTAPDTTLRHSGTSTKLGDSLTTDDSRPMRCCLAVAPPAFFCRRCRRCGRRCRPTFSFTLESSESETSSDSESGSSRCGLEARLWSLSPCPESAVLEEPPIKMDVLLVLLPLLLKGQNIIF